MTHDELITKINDVDLRTCWMALRAVVELHKPFDDKTCSACFNTAYREFDPYPCSTIQAIEKELK